MISTIIVTFVILILISLPLIVISPGILNNGFYTLKSLNLLQLDDENTDESSVDDSLFISFCCIGIILFSAAIFIPLYKAYKKNEDKQNIPKYGPVTKAIMGQSITNSKHTTNNQSQLLFQSQTQPLAQGQDQQQNYSYPPPTWMVQQTSSGSEEYSLDSINPNKNANQAPVSGQAMSPQASYSPAEASMMNTELYKNKYGLPEKSDADYAITHEEIKKDKEDQKVESFKPISKPEDINDSVLGKMRMENSELNQDLYTLESEKAMGKISTSDFNKKKLEIIQKHI